MVHKDQLKDLLKENLTLDIRKYKWNEKGFELVIKFDGEVITTDYYYLEEVYED